MDSYIISNNSYNSSFNNSTGSNNNSNNNNSSKHLVDPDENSDCAANEGKIFIGGLCWQTTTETLKNYFGKFGEISDCTIMKDLVTKRSRGFGFVNFLHTDSVEKVLNSGPHTIDEKVVDAKVAVPRPKAGSIPSKTITKTKKIFVGGLSAPTTADDIRRYFETFGAVTEAVLMIDKQTHRHRGFGFVTFENEDVAEQVCHKPFHEVNNKMVECKKALPKELMISQTPSKSVFSLAFTPTLLSCGRSFAMPSYYYQTGIGGYTLIPAVNGSTGRMLHPVPGNFLSHTADFTGALVPANQLNSSLLPPQSELVSPRSEQSLVFQRPPIQSPVQTPPILSLLDYNPPADFIIGVPVSNGYHMNNTSYIAHPSPVPIGYSQSNSPSSITAYQGQMVAQAFQNGFH